MIQYLNLNSNELVTAVQWHGDNEDEVLYSCGAWGLAFDTMELDSWIVSENSDFTMISNETFWLCYVVANWELSL